MFHALSREEHRVDREDPVAKRSKRGWPSSRSSSTITPAALAKVAEVGFDPVYGARPLKRAIQQEIENPLAKEILAGKFVAGDTVHVAEKQGAITFAKR